MFIARGPVCESRSMISVIVVSDMDIRIGCVFCRDYGVNIRKLWMHSTGIIS